MNERRGFLKGFGVLGAVLSGLSASAAGANAAILGAGNVPDNNVSPIQPQCETIDHLAPTGAMCISIVGNPAPQPAQPVTPHGLCFAPTNQNYQNKVDLSVGLDDRLWVRVGDKWHRVVLEG